MRRFFKAVGKFIWDAVKLLIILVLLAVLIAGIWVYHEYAGPVLSLRAKAEGIAKYSTEEDF